MIFHADTIAYSIVKCNRGAEMRRWLLTWRRAYFIMALIIRHVFCIDGGEDYF